MSQTLDELDELVVEVFPGYCPHYYLAYTQCLLEYGEEDQHEFTMDLIRRARQVGEMSQNPWAAQATEHLEQPIGRKSR